MLCVFCDGQGSKTITGEKSSGVSFTGNDNFGLFCVLFLWGFFDLKIAHL